jgi:hypothetical protein
MDELGIHLYTSTVMFLGTLQPLHDYTPSSQTKLTLSIPEVLTPVTNALNCKRLYLLILFYKSCNYLAIQGCLINVRYLKQFQEMWNV